MLTTIRAILIDPFEKSISEVQHPAGDRPQDYYKAIGHGCHCITTVGMPPYGRDRQTLILDDEGLYVPDQRFFQLLGYPQPLAGRALLVGVDDSGAAVSTDMPIEVVAAGISWPEIDFAGIESEPPREEEDYRGMGKFTVLSSRATFRKRSH